MGWVGGALWVFLAGPCEAAESVRGKQPEPLPVTQSPTTHAGFSLVPLSESGISFTNMLSVARAAANHNFMNGSGVALGDFDGDGLCDIYLCSLTGKNALYQNLGGWRFRNVAVEAGVEGGGRVSTGAAFADLNGDGRLDLVVTACGGPNSVYWNQGKGAFREAVLPPGEVMRTGSTSVAFADIDGDGDLDVYVANYGEISVLRSGGMPATRKVNGKDEVIGRFRHRIRIRDDGKMVEYGEPDVLYRNDGQGGFVPVPWTGGAFLDEDGRPLASSPWDFGLAVMFRDINGDGFPDLYVCNDFQTPDRIWINDGRGVFRALPRLALRQTSNFSMSVDFADVDRDGHFDFFLADMLSRSHVLRMVQADGNERLPHPIGEIEDRPQVRQNSLMRARGDGTFSALARSSGLQASDWTWSSVFLDVDLDGFEDLLIGNGHMFDAQDLDGVDRSRAVGRGVPGESLKKLEAYPELKTPNFAFRNRGDLTFEERGMAWGFHSTEVSHGMALGDLDGDGDLDVVVNVLNAPPLVYRNDAGGARVAVKLRGRGGNTSGIGARIVVRGGAVPFQSQEMIAGGRYLSGDEAKRVFAAGVARGSMTIEVFWRSGAASKVESVLPGHLYEIEEPAEAGSRSGRSLSAVPASVPFFEDWTGRVGQRHEESLFNDFERQPALIHRFSQLGPGVAVADLNGDAHDDLFLGGGRGGRALLFQGDGAGSFQAVALSGIWTNLTDDVLGLALGMGDGEAPMLAALLSNYESPPGSPARVLGWHPKLQLDRAMPLEMGAGVVPATLATADMDGDGDLDLFVGGRLKWGRYPEPVPSWLYRWEGDAWRLDREWKDQHGSGSMVSAALWSDLNVDGFPELVLASDWGPVRVFANERGKLKEATEDWGLGGPHGRWNSVCSADLDGDGLMDLVAGNWGANTPWTASPAHPMELVYGDFDGNGQFDLVEAQWEPSLNAMVPLRNLQWMSQAIPMARSRFATHRDYGKASLSQVLGDWAPGAGKAWVSTLETTAWLNRRGKFEPLKLPPPAQWAPVFGISASDFNGDGLLDLFLAENFFAMRPEDGRLDAGTGLLLFGIGRGEMRAASSEETGLRVYGEQRGCAVADWDEDGRPDLAVAQNAAAVRVFRNAAGKPGLRVRFAGPRRNPSALGLSARLRHGDTWGPRQEVRGGGGSLSQDSTILVFPQPSPPSAIQVVWPGGRVMEGALPAGAREIRINEEGKIEKLR